MERCDLSDQANLPGATQKSAPEGFSHPGIIRRGEDVKSARDSQPVGSIGREGPEGIVDPRLSFRQCYAKDTIFMRQRNLLPEVPESYRLKLSIPTLS
jgi:hypothetical protein